MKYGEKCRLFVDYEYAFGKYDNPHGFHGSNIMIPARSKIMFELHLINPKLAVRWSLTFLTPQQAKSSREWLEFADKQKAEGNAEFGKKNFDEALKLYNKTLEILTGIKKNLERAPPADLKEEHVQKWKEDNGMKQ